MKRKTSLLCLATICLLSSSRIALAGSPAKLATNIECAVSSLGSSSQKYSAEMQSDTLFEIYDHHQAQAVSHRFSDGSRLVFISHSETRFLGLKNKDQKGQLLAFRASAGMWDESTDILSKDQKMPRVARLLISEQHPSGIEWLPGPNNADFGFLFVASPETQSAEVWRFNLDGSSDYVGSLDSSSGDLRVSDVMLVERDGVQWVMLHEQNQGRGEAFALSKGQLFSGEKLNLHALDFKNKYAFPGTQSTGGGKKLGQNAAIVQDSSGAWFVVHSYTTSDGQGTGDSKVKAFAASFANGKFSVTGSTPVATKTLATGTTYLTANADGAAGFRVTAQGRLTALLGAQYSVAGSSALREYVSAKTCK